MATTKTLTPTNQAITIAAFTEKPDNRVNATNDDKLADAVNALNSKFGNQSHGLTAASNVTLSAAYKAIAGTIKCYNLRISTTAQIAADTSLVSGFDAPALDANGGAVGLGFNNATKGSKTFFLSADGTLRCAENIPSGTDWRINLVYRG